MILCFLDFAVCLQNDVFVYENNNYNIGMKRKLFMLLLSPIVLSCVGCKSDKVPDKGPVDVVVISGQSNAVGCTVSNYIKTSLGEDKYNEFAEGYDDIKISFDSWTKDGFDTGNYTYYSQNSSGGKYVKVKLGQGNGPSSFGPEIGIAEATHERRGGKLFIIKYACGASNLKDDWTNKDSPMYGRFIKYVKSAMKVLSNQGYKPTIKAFCWMQGEGDTYNGYYQYYKQNLRTFVGNVREDLYKLSGNKDVPFIDAKIAGDNWQYWAQVNIAKREFSEESDNNYLIDTIVAGMHTTVENNDKAHYDSDSEVQLGHLFAEAFEPFLMEIVE